MENSKNLIFIQLIGALCTDLMFPYLIAPFYRGYRHTHMVMSVLGAQKNPMHLLYNLWLILLGILIIMGSIQLFSIIRENKKNVSIMFLK